MVVVWPCGGEYGGTEEVYYGGVVGRYGGIECRRKRRKRRRRKNETVWKVVKNMTTFEDHLTY